MLYNNTIMPEKIDLCPLCKSKDSATHFWVYQHTNRPDAYHDICHECGAVFMNPRPTKEELDKYYEKEYREQVHDGQVEQAAKGLSGGLELKRAQRLMWWIARHVPTVNRHLDIGSSLGFLLNYIAVQYKCESVGIEPGNAYRKLAQEALDRVGQPVTFYTDISELPETPQFDLITMSHVLEHLPEPLEYLEDIVNRYLKPGGHFVIEVPNVLGEITALIYPHLIGFSQETLWMTMNKAGLTPFSVETSYVGGQIHIAPPPYLTAIGRKGIYDLPKEYKEIYGMVVAQWQRLYQIRNDMKKQAEEGKNEALDCADGVDGGGVADIPVRTGDDEG